MTRRPAVREPVARSPISPRPPVLTVAGWEVSGARAAGPLTLTDCTPLAKVLLRAPHDGFMAASVGVPFGRADRAVQERVAVRDTSAESHHREQDEPGARIRAHRDAAGVLLVGSGPGEWLAIGPPGSGPDLRARFTALAERAPDEHLSVVDLTHGRALIRLAGPGAQRVLASVCGIDFGAAVTPDGAALRSGVAGLATDIIRDDAAGAPSYLLHCERSSGQYLFDAVLRAGARFGIEIDGFADPATTGGSDDVP